MFFGVCFLNITLTCHCFLVHLYFNIGSLPLFADCSKLILPVLQVDVVENHVCWEVVHKNVDYWWFVQLIFGWFNMKQWGVFGDVVNDLCGFGHFGHEGFVNLILLHDIVNDYFSDCCFLGRCGSFESTCVELALKIRKDVSVDVTLLIQFEKSI